MLGSTLLQNSVNNHRWCSWVLQGRSSDMIPWGTIPHHNNRYQFLLVPILHVYRDWSGALEAGNPEITGCVFTNKSGVWSWLSSRLSYGLLWPSSSVATDPFRRDVPHWEMKQNVNPFKALPLGIKHITIQYAWLLVEVYVAIKKNEIMILTGKWKFY